MTQTPAQHRASMRKYNKTFKAKKDRAARNKARRHAIREGWVKKGDGKDIDHKDGNVQNNRPSNWRVRSASANRRDNEHGGHKKRRKR